MGAGSEKRAAVIRKGAEREKRDLFATRPPDLGSIKQTVLPPPGGVGARNENSVLFTVADVRPSKKVNDMGSHESAPPPSSLASDDDGIIDLMALSSRPPPPRPAVGPLFAPPVSEPPSGFAREIAASSSGFAAVTKSKLGAHKAVVFAALGAVAFLVLTIVGVSAVFSEGDTARRALAWNHLPAPKVAAAAPAETSDDSEPDEKSDRVEKKRGKGKKGKARRGGAAAASKASFSPKKTYSAPKAKDTCGCKGDFNCILRCTAKGK